METEILLSDLESLQKRLEKTNRKKLEKDEYFRMSGFIPDKHDLDLTDKFWEWLDKFDGKTPKNPANPAGDKYPDLKSAISNVKSKWESGEIPIGIKKQFILNLAKRAIIEIEAIRAITLKIELNNMY